MQSYLPDLFLLTMVLIQVALPCKKQPLRLSLSFIQRDVYTDTFAQTYARTHTQSHTQRLWETMGKKYDNILRKDMFLKWIKVLLLNNRKALAYSLAVGKCKWKTQCCKNWLVPDICVCVFFFSWTVTFWAPSHLPEGDSYTGKHCEKTFLHRSVPQGPSTVHNHRMERSEAAFLVWLGESQLKMTKPHLWTIVSIKVCNWSEEHLISPLFFPSLVFILSKYLFF